MRRTPPGRDKVTGLVLAGGRGARFGGVDKGLLPWAGDTLAGHAARRLAPQVAAVAISANRHLERHAAAGWPVWPDDALGGPAAADGHFGGPLAGWLAGLRRADTEWLLAVPCDTPLFPADLPTRLYAALALPAAPPMAVAATPDGLQPVFALLHRTLAPALEAALAEGTAGAGRFARAQGAAVVCFGDASAFADADTPSALAALEARAADAPRR